MTPSSRTSVIQVLHMRPTLKNSPPTSPKKRGLVCCNATRSVMVEVVTLLTVFLLHRSEEHTSELQSHLNLVCRLLLEKKKTNTNCHRPRARAPPSDEYLS